MASTGYPAPQELRYQQRLDHFKPEDTRRWPHRYLLNNDTWDGRGLLENGCRGPILLYTGNEGPIDAFWNVTGFVVETLARSLGGLVLFSEQRFFGSSLPFGDASHTAEHLKYLTTAQVCRGWNRIDAWLHGPTYQRAWHLAHRLWIEPTSAKEAVS